MSTTFKIDYSTLVRQAVIGAFLKLNPRDEIKNLVMFVVWLGSILTTFWLYLPFREFCRGHGGGSRKGACRRAAQNADQDDGPKAGSGRRGGGFQQRAEDW
jgi:hypothetical protein